MNLLGRSASNSSDNGAYAINDANNVAGPGVMPHSQVSAEPLDLDFLIGNHSQRPNVSNQKGKNAVLSPDENLNGDDAMVDLSDDGSVLVAPSVAQISTPSEDASQASTHKAAASDSNGALRTYEGSSTEEQSKSGVGSGCESKPPDSTKTVEVKPLNDISISLDSIKPGEQL